jgi:multicomponent Na+:H+ antiporter subunit B
MTPSLILRTATRLLVPLMLLFSIYLLVQGHNAPGGGFSGGLVAAGAFALYAVAFGAQQAADSLPMSPLVMIALGLGFALFSGLLSVLAGFVFLEGMWLIVGGLHLGTPLIFDIGVYLLVAGAVLAIVLALEDAYYTLFPR